MASLDRRASAVREACGDSIEIQHAVESRVDALVSRWSQLTEPQLDVEENLVTATPKFPISMMQQPTEVSSMCLILLSMSFWLKWESAGC